MGSYLGKRGSPAPSPAEGRTDPPAGLGNRRPAQPLHQLHRVQHVHRAHPAPRLGPSRRPRDWDPAKPTTRGVSEAWRRFPMRRPQNSVVGPLPSDWWESYLKRSVWSLRHPRAVWSPVTIKITPPGRRGLPDTSPAQSSPSGKPPGRCVKATVLRAVRECAKGRTGPREPLLRDRPRCERRAPGSRPSAFEPLVKNGVRASFVPRPGPLSRSSASRSSDRTRTGGPLGSKRNAITSSYSSSRASSERRKRSVPGAPLQTPERPVKKEEKGHQCRSPIPLGSEESPAASRDSSGQRSRKMPQLLASPGPLLPLPPAPQRGYAASEDHLALGTKGGLLWGNEARKDTTEVTADSVRDSRSALPPPLALALPSAGTAPALGPDSQGESPGPLASPQSTAEGVSVALSPLQTPSLLAPLGCSLSESRPGPASGAKSPATVTLPIPVSPTSPVIDTTQPPPTSQDDRSARSPQPPVISPAQRCLFGKVRPARHLSASAPPAAASADPTSKCVFGPPPKSETGDALHFRMATAALSPPGSLAPTFEPVFGSIGPLNTMPVTGAFSPRQTCCPAPPAPTHTSHDLVKATSVVVSTAPASSSKDSSFKPPLGFDVVSVTSAADSTPSLPSTCHTFLLGAARAFRASFSTATGFILPPHHPAAIPRVHTVAIFSQALPTAAQMTASRSTVGFRGVGSPLSASALMTTNQPALSSGISNLTSAFTIPLGSNSKPPFPPSLGVTSQPAFGAAGGREQGLLQPVFGPSFNSSFIFKNSKVESPTPSPTPTPIPTPAQPAFSSPTQSAFGLLTPSASTFHIPASNPPDSGSTPAFGQASATCFGLVTEAHRSGASSSVFGSTAPRPFAFGGLVTPMDCGESGVSMTAPDRSSNSGVFCIGAMPGGATRTVMPFGKIWSQNTQALTSQSTPFALGRASISARRAVFGDHHIVPFAQSTPVPGPVKTGRSLGFGVPSLAAQGSFERGSFRSPAPSFSIGAKPKTPKSREQGHSRRHHAHKK
ncbi:POM121-like protein 2 [Pteropus vampyrus]|uniref:POM121-like protein 2 n=1 Tax=Pteropus vampyrus TaxID=132908 RepID=A0A6P3QII0_PTEVA|nr:POM121-like protein 2 [Pteropus vampyrus]